MFKKLLLVSSLVVALNASISIQEIDSKPPSRAKNFMIWQYLKQNITSKEADYAYSQVLGSIPKIRKLHAKKSKTRAKLKPTRKDKCRAKKNLLEIVDKECLDWAINPYKTLRMSNFERKLLSLKVDSTDMKRFLSLQSEPMNQDSFEKYSSNAVLKLFVNTTQTNRRKNLNMHLSPDFLNKLSSSKKINYFVKIVLEDKKLDKLRYSITRMSGKNLNGKSNFSLALYCLENKQYEKAMKFFNYTSQTAKRQRDKDKGTFWMYQVSKKKKYLEKLLISRSINIYTLYAHEILGKDVVNYFSAVETTTEKTKQSIRDPFEWMKIKKEIRATPKKELFELAKKYKQKEMIPVQTHILERAYGYNMHGFVMPYDEYLKDVSTDDKALVYAIMKQESVFIPAALSRSFALGLMQIMPFVTDDISKRMEKPIKSYSDMFQPEYNIKYALSHLNWQKKSLYHPLFMAYAYNGGMGFLRKHLRTTGAFSQGKYEPFLSMETMKNAESREYGKRVLSNYVMYKKILGEEVSIVRLFDTLMHPKMTDRFRKQG